MTKTAEKLNVCSCRNNEFVLEGVSSDEINVLMGSFKAGHNWVRRGDNGHLEHVSSYEELPNPVTDEEMHPFWEPIETQKVQVQLEMFSHMTTPDDYSKHSSASIIVQHLCGYGYTKENYKRQAKLLESFGFECLRSRRGDDGKFWELWFLPGVWAAKGVLREAIDSSNYKNQKLKTEVAVEFLRRNASFGTLDVSVQRLAQVIE